jgi:hypothetical protein
MLYVADGSFFQPVDTFRYRLSDDGTLLALGLAVLSSALAAHSAAEDIDEALKKLLEPIGALDETADLPLSALIVAVIGEQVPNEVIAGIARSFLALQNLNHSRYDEFRSLVRRAPAAFLLAVEEAVLEDNLPQNFAWLTDCLQADKDDPGVRAALGTACDRWLSMYLRIPLIVDGDSRSSWTVL